MPIASLVVSGLSFQVDKYLKTSSFNPKLVFHKGEVPSRDNPQKIPRPDSGFLQIISEREEATLMRVIEDTMTFLAKNEKEVRRSRQLGADNWLVDLSYPRNDSIDHTEYLPPEFIRMLADRQMGIVVSVYSIPTG